MIAGTAPGNQPATAPMPTESVTFKLVPAAQFVTCIARFPGDAARALSAEVRLSSCRLNDRLVLTLKNIKPRHAFDLFTVQRSPQKADGTPDARFTNFGLAWYQSDVEVGADGSATVEVKTILLNQIFGFDPAVNLSPTNTFHVGISFNDPADAAPRGFNVNNRTPFNGDHGARPLAIVSLPNAATRLGPLCTHPNTSTNPVSCNP